MLESDHFQRCLHNVNGNTARPDARGKRQVFLSLLRLPPELVVRAGLPPAAQQAGRGQGRRRGALARVASD